MDVWQLSDRLLKAEQHSQQAHSSQDIAVLSRLQKQVADVQAAQGRMQHGMAELGQALDQARGRRQPALPWRPSHDTVSLLLSDLCWPMLLYHIGHKAH